MNPTNTVTPPSPAYPDPSTRMLRRAKEATGIDMTPLAYRGYHALGYQTEHAWTGQPFTLADYEAFGRTADRAAELAADERATYTSPDAARSHLRRL